MKKASRRVVDLSSYPDLVVMYLGMRVKAFTGIKTLIWGSRSSFHTAVRA